jgi:hypothetical protein
MKWFWRVSNAKSEKINLNFVNEVILDGFNRQKWGKKKLKMKWFWKVSIARSEKIKVKIIIINELILEGFDRQKLGKK